MGGQPRLGLPVAGSRNKALVVVPALLTKSKFRGETGEKMQHRVSEKMFEGRMVSSKDVSSRLGVQLKLN
jgi:hypothetical protein